MSRKKKRGAELFGPHHPIEYKGGKRFVSLNLPAGTGGGFAVLTNLPGGPIKFVAANYPDNSPSGRARFDAKCARATDLACKAIQGGATLDEAKLIARACLRTEIDIAERARVEPLVRSRARSNANLKRTRGITKVQAQAAVTIHRTQVLAAEALGISDRALRMIINGK